MFTQVTSCRDSTIFASDLYRFTGQPFAVQIDCLYTRRLAPADAWHRSKPGQLMARRRLVIDSTGVKVLGRLGLFHAPGNPAEAQDTGI